MQGYFNFGQTISHEEKEDVISAEEFPSDDRAHPRTVILVRRTNGRPYPFLTTSVMDIINKGNGCDPVTRQPFSPLTIQRADLYNRSLVEFPDYQVKSLNTKDLYIRWINTHKSNTRWTDEIARTRLEARCFLQAEDLMGIFQTFSGKGSIANRDSSVEFLRKTNRDWVLRHCSLKDTEYDKAYALTYLLPNGNPTHIVIVHRIGEGFYYDILINRKSSIDFDFEYARSYPTIVNLLEAEIPKLLTNTANSGIEEVDIPAIFE